MNINKKLELFYLRKKLMLTFYFNVFHTIYAILT